LKNKYNQYSPQTPYLFTCLLTPSRKQSNCQAVIIYYTEVLFSNRKIYEIAGCLRDVIDTTNYAVRKGAVGTPNDEF